MSRKLETSPHGPGRGKKSLPVDGKPFKAEALKTAGLSTSTANRCEQLAANPQAVERYITAQADAGKAALRSED